MVQLYLGLLKIGSDLFLVDRVALTTDLDYGSSLGNCLFIMALGPTFLVAFGTLPASP